VGILGIHCEGLLAAPYFALREAPDWAFYKVDPDDAIGVAVRLRLSLADFDAAVTAK
jgi:hypothetical protein